jgi:CBS domain-containing protein
MALTEINVQTPGSVYSVTDHRARVSRVAVPEILIGADEMNTEARIQHQTAAELTCALDVMTEKVISIRPDMATRDIANLLLTNRISAVPVVDSDGVPIGMVSEGDLIGRDESDRLARSDWWLGLLAGRLPLDEKFTARVQAKDITARDVMSGPLVTVTEDTDVSQIARLFAIHHIKRVPVVRDGRVVGIVSRADLLRAVAAKPLKATGPQTEKHKGLLASFFGDYHLPARETVDGIKASREAPAVDETRLAATDFRHLVQDFHADEVKQHDEARHAAAAQRRERAKQLIDEHIFGDGWRELMHQARVAAENGEREVLLLRFPSQLCIDGGRAINVHEPTWPMTLRGEPAEIYLRWERELKPQGFSLSARILSYPDGKPGDISLFLVWENETKS